MKRSAAVLIALAALALAAQLLAPPVLYVVGPSGDAATLDFAGPESTYGRQCTTDTDCLTHCGPAGDRCIPAGWISEVAR